MTETETTDAEQADLNAEQADLNEQAEVAATEEPGEPPAPRYEWGHHASDPECPHVALVTSEGRDELFDVRLYHVERGEEIEGDPAFVESKAALELLLARANGVFEAIERIQRMRDERKHAGLAWYVDRFTAESSEGKTTDELAELHAADDWSGWDVANASDIETWESGEGAVEAYDAALDVLTALAHGRTPAQGEDPATDIFDGTATGWGRDR